MNGTSAIMATLSAHFGLERPVASVTALAKQQTLDVVVEGVKACLPTILVPSIPDGLASRCPYVRAILSIHAQGVVEPPCMELMYDHLVHVAVRLDSDVEEEMFTLVSVMTLATRRSGSRSGSRELMYQMHTARAPGGRWLTEFHSMFPVTVPRPVRKSVRLWYLATVYCARKYARTCAEYDEILDSTVDLYIKLRKRYKRTRHRQIRKSTEDLFFEAVGVTFPRAIGEISTFWIVTSGGIEFTPKSIRVAKQNCHELTRQFLDNHDLIVNDTLNNAAIGRIQVPAIVNK